MPFVLGHMYFLCRFCVSDDKAVDGIALHTLQVHQMVFVHDKPVLPVNHLPDAALSDSGFHTLQDTA
jgi:hypothetical protein